jgi:Golgi SNAP receptor complex protein 2
MMDVMNTLGLSTSLMGVIERRQRMDGWFVYLGIVICCLFMYGMYWWKYLRGATSGEVPINDIATEG